MRIFLATLSALAFTAPAMAATPALTKADVEKIVHDYLLEKPEVIEEAVGKLREKKQVQEEKQQKDGLGKYHAELFKDTTSPAVGADASKADVTLVEFFDYHCGYCKHVLPTITQLVKDDAKVRVIFREFPILSEDSETAAKAALAINRIAPKKYFDFHTALMNESGKFNEDRLLEIAKGLGVDSEKLKAEMKKPDIQAMLDKNRQLAQSLSIRGTPAIILSNDAIVPGAIGIEDLKKLVADARKGKK